MKQQTLDTLEFSPKINSSELLIAGRLIVGGWNLIDWSIYGRAQSGDNI